MTTKAKFNWESLSLENLQVVQKVIKVTLNHLQFFIENFSYASTSPIPVTIPLQKFEREGLTKDDVSNVLQNVEGVKISVEEFLFSQDAVEPLWELPILGDELYYLPPKEHRRDYLFLRIYSTDELYKLRDLIDKKLLDISSYQKYSTRLDSKEKKANFANEQEKIQVQVTSGLLILNKRTGLVRLNRVENAMNPIGQEAIFLQKLMEDNSYQVSYEELLNGHVTKDAKRQLGSVLKNLKKFLGILPKNKAQNSDCIENIKGFGYRLIIKPHSNRIRPH